MSGNRSQNGREGSPLWSNVNTGAGLSFTPSQFQPLLVPMSVPTDDQSNLSAVDGGEADHFLGQDSPPPMQPVSSSADSAQLFAAPSSISDSFAVGFGSAPPPASNSAAQLFQTVSSSSTELQVDVGPPPQIFQQPPPAMQPQNQPQFYQPQKFSNQPMQAQVPPTSQFEQFSEAPPPMTSAPTHVAEATAPITQPLPVANPTMQYSPVVQHWFYCKVVSGQSTWFPFSHKDSMYLEEAFLNGEPEIIPTDGGRYDVSITERRRTSVYWSEPDCEVRRCSWFHREDSNMKHVPYSEEMSEELEELYMQTLYNNSWHKRNEIQSSRDVFVFHSANVFVQFSKGSFPDEFGVALSEMSPPKVVKRGMDEIENISNGEPQQIDELVFVVHGIGPVCDLKFRSIVECVDSMRTASLSMLKTHFTESQSSNKIGRVEFIPIYWYDALRNEAIGVDRRLANITLQSVPKIRELTNEVLLDILFYNSPLYSQSILDKVGGELNRLYNLFSQRNPGWKGNVSLAGHSLGSLVLFDLLSMQGVSQAPVPVPQPAAGAQSNSARGTPLSQNDRSRSATPSSTPIDNKMVAIETMETVLEHLSLSNLSDKFYNEQIDLESLLMCSEDDLKSIGLPLGPRKKILKFVADREKAKAAKSEPVAVAEPVSASLAPSAVTPDLNRSHSWLVETASNTQVGYVGGLNGVGFPLVQYPQLDFKVSKFFALGSPIAMFLTIRGVENLSRDFHLPTCTAMFNIFHPYDPVAYRIEPLINPDIKKKAMLIPHHKGRKRLHLELKENIAKVGADIKDKVMRSLKSTWATINNFAQAHRSSGQAAIEDEQQLSDHVDAALQGVTPAEDHSAELESVSSIAEGEVEVGQLNQGRRIDYVLQEAPFESFNEYLFALASHLVYWESEDVALMLMKEVYEPLGVHADKKKQQMAAPADLSMTSHHAAGSYPSQPRPSYPSQPAEMSYPSQPPQTYPSQPPQMYAPQTYPSQPQQSYPSQPTKQPYHPNQQPQAYLNNPTMINTASINPASGPPPMSGFIAGSGPPPRGGFVPRQ